MRKTIDSGFILPFLGRNVSDIYNQNLLYKCDSIYIMDNHRAALWCWLQHIKKEVKYNILHIDQHFDCLSSRLDEWVDALPQDIGQLDIQEYLNLCYVPPDSPTKNIPIFRYDNYMSIFLRLYELLLDKSVFATHNKGDSPNYKRIDKIPVYKLISYVSHYLKENKWIVNIDLDYFFYSNYYDEYNRLCSDEYVDELFDEISTNNDQIEVITLCLSPETCGGWGPSEKVIDKICKKLAIDFAIP